VQLQTWLREERARYWVVDVTRQSRDVNNRSGSDSDNASATIKAEIEEWIKKEEGQIVDKMGGNTVRARRSERGERGGGASVS
jgi:hypothetical protein